MAALLWSTTRQFSVKSCVSFIASREVANEVLQICPWDCDIQVTKNQIKLSKTISDDEVLAFASALEGELLMLGFREQGDSLATARSCTSSSAQGPARPPAESQ